MQNPHQFQGLPCQRLGPELEFALGLEMPAFHISPAERHCYQQMSSLLSNLKNFLIFLLFLKPESRRGWQRRTAGCQAGFCKHSSQLRQNQWLDRRGKSPFCEKYNFSCRFLDALASLESTVVGQSVSQWAAISPRSQCSPINQVWSI